MLNDTQDSMDLNLLILRGGGELQTAGEPLQKLIAGGFPPDQEHTVLAKWEQDIQVYGRTQELVGEMAQYTCGVMKEAIYEGTTGDFSHRGSSGHGSGGGGGCPWYLFLFCWINDLFSPLNFPWGGDPHHGTLTTILYSYIHTYMFTFIYFIQNE